MLEVLVRVFDRSGFPPRAAHGEWTPALVWFHVTGDLLIWLAFLAIPLVLLYFTHRRDLPFPRLFTLFAIFLFACGTTFLLDALTFEYPLYRLLGVLKAITAVLSWVTVIALIPVVPKVMSVQPSLPKRSNETKLHRALPEASTERRADAYLVAIAAALIAILIRALLDPLVKDDAVLVVSLLAVVYVSWRHGFYPAIITLVIGMIGYLYLFFPPRSGFILEGVSGQLAIALFFFCGVMCAALGESQRAAQRRAKSALGGAIARQEELESEIIRRRVVEAALRQREAELLTAQRETAEALARLNAFLDNAPVGIAFLDTNLRYVQVNRSMADFHALPAGDHLGKTVPEVQPHFPADVLASQQAVVDSTAEPAARSVTLLKPNDRRKRTFQVVTFPVRTADNRSLGLGMISEDITDRLKAEEELRRNEMKLADFFENANIGFHWVGPDGIILRANKAELEMLGYTREEYVGRHIAEFHANQATINDILTRLTCGERLDNYAAELRCKDGSTRDVLISSSVLWEEGRFIHTRCFTRDVTELKRATDALRRSEERFRLMAQTVPSILWTATPDGTIDWVNDRWLEYCGITAEQNARGWPELVLHPDDYDRCMEEWNRSLKEGTEYEIEVRNRRYDGEYRWFITRAIPVREHSGEIRAWFGVTTDIHEQKTSADAIRESEARFRSMADSAPALIWLTEFDQRRTYFNKTWLNFTGRTLTEELGEGWDVNIHPDDRERYMRVYSDAIAARRPFGLEYRLRRHDGVYRWVMARGTPRFTPAGAFAGFVGLCIDVSDRREAEEALRQSEERFRTLTEAVPQMVWTANPKGEITFCNRRWSEYTGLSLDSARDRGWGADLLHPDDAEQVRGGWLLAVEQQADAYRQEFRLRRASDGTHRWFLSSAIPFRDNTGAISEWVGTLTDIDDQKRHTQTLEEMVRERTTDLERLNLALRDEVEERKAAETQVTAVAAELKRSNQELEKFAYVASHDLQEPLRKIQAFGARLETKCRESLPEVGKEYVDRMLSAAGRMRRLIDDLLSFSRVATQKREFTRTDLDEVVREVISDLEESIDSAGGKVEIGSLPAIEADPMQMRQLFQNLIGNAIKFHQPGVPPVVTVSAEVRTESNGQSDAQPAGLCHLRVQDNGIGFDEKYRERIFEVFQRLHGKNAYDGTGIGLAICRKIVERHGGTITAHSREGEGATFHITLPLRPPIGQEVSNADA